MKAIINILVLCVFVGLLGCQQEEGVEKNYWLYQAGFTPTNGNVKATDLGDGSIKLEIQLKPFIPGQYPSHLHFGDILETGELAVRLTDLDGKTGKSVTILKDQEMSNGELLTFQKFLALNASIRVHTNDLLNKSVVVAYGNVGKNDNYLDVGLSTCIGH
jgi:hypothetical protein